MLSGAVAVRRSERLTEARSTSACAGSGARRHREDVGDVDQAKRLPRDDPLLRRVVELRERTPEVARAHEQLADLLLLVRMAVRLAARVQREPEHADRVGL